MEQIFKTILGKTSEDYLKYVEGALDPSRTPLLSSREREAFTYLRKVYEDTASFPSEVLFFQEFEDLELPVSSADPLSDHDLDIVYKQEFIRRSKQLTSRELMKMASGVVDSGFTDDLYDRIRTLYHLNQDKELTDEAFSLESIRDIYQDKKTKSAGLLTFVKAVDEKIGSLTLGTVNVLFGWVGSFKTTWALNMLYNNTFRLGYNAVYISLEVPKEDIMFNLLSRHSFDPKFSQYSFVPHEKIRKTELTEEEEDFVFNEVLTDLAGNSKGKLIILDETDFKTFSPGEIRAKLEEIDERLLAEDMGCLDAVFWDHANLFKFSGEQGRYMNQGDIINHYVSFIRQLSIKFVKDKGSDTYRTLCNVVLAQANRDGWKRADKAGGRYTLVALSEANELERAAYRVFSVYTNEDLKQSKEATVQVLKNRSGATLWEPTPIFVDPEAYIAGDELEGFDEMLSTDDFDSVFGGDSDLGF